MKFYPANVHSWKVPLAFDGGREIEATIEVSAPKVKLSEAEVEELVGFISKALGVGGGSDA